MPPAPPFHIYPSVDLRGGKVVRLAQGDFARQTDYDVDPVAQVKGYIDAGATHIHLVDLDGAKAGRPAQTDLLAKMIASVPGSVMVQVGGGVRGTADVEALLAAGASRVVVGTAALENWAWFEGLAARPDLAGKLVLALDAKDGVVATRGWQHSSGKLATDLARVVSDWPLAALLYTDVAVDGMLTGPNYPRTAELAQATKVPVLASGGVGHLDHILQCAQTGARGVIVGRAIYEGNLDLRAAFEAVGRL